MPLRRDVERDTPSRALGWFAAISRSTRKFARFEVVLPVMVTFTKSPSGFPVRKSPVSEELMVNGTASAFGAAARLRTATAAVIVRNLEIDRTLPPTGLGQRNYCYLGCIHSMQAPIRCAQGRRRECAAPGFPAVFRAILVFLARPSATAVAARASDVRRSFDDSLLFVDAGLRSLETACGANLNDFDRVDDSATIARAPPRHFGRARR